MAYPRIIFEPKNLQRSRALQNFLRETGLRDEDLSSDGRFIYVLNADSRRIFGWAVGDDGTLSCTAIAAGSVL